MNIHQFELKVSSMALIKPTHRVDFHIMEDFERLLMTTGVLNDLLFAPVDYTGKLTGHKKIR
jgi:hypothetical protein